MSPQERSALGALVGRTLTAEESSQVDLWLPGRRDDLIAGLLSVGRVKIVSHFASERGILERFPGGPIAADTLLGKLDAFSQSPHPMASIVKRALKFLGQPDGIDLGSAAVQALLEQLQQGGVISADERNGLRAMATQAAPISVGQVSDALNKAQAQ